MFVSTSLFLYLLLKVFYHTLFGANRKKLYFCRRYE